MPFCMKRKKNEVIPQPSVDAPGVGDGEGGWLFSYRKGKIGVQDSGCQRMSSQTKRESLFRDPVFEHFDDHIDRLVTRAHCIATFLMNKENGATPVKESPQRKPIDVAVVKSALHTPPSPHDCEDHKDG